MIQCFHHSFYRIDAYTGHQAAFYYPFIYTGFKFAEKMRIFQLMFSGMVTAVRGFTKSLHLGQPRFAVLSNRFIWANRGSRFYQSASVGQTAGRESFNHTCFARPRTAVKVISHHSEIL